LNGVEPFHSLLETATDPESVHRSNEPQADEDGRPTIVITTREHKVNDDAVAALGADKAIYQRGGLLVRVSETVEAESRSIRRPAGPHIEPLLPPTLRERLTQVARWIKLVTTKDGEVEQPAHPPAWCVSAVYSRGNWPLLRPLEAIVEYPIL